MNFYLFNFVGNSALSWINTGISFLSLCLTGVIAWFVYDYSHKRWLKNGFLNHKVDLINKYLVNLQYIEEKRKHFLEIIESDNYYDLDSFLESLDKILTKIQEIREDESKIINELTTIKEFNQTKLENNLNNINYFLIKIKKALRKRIIGIESPEENDDDFFDFFEYKKLPQKKDLSQDLKEKLKFYKCFNFQHDYIKEKRYLLSDSDYIEILIKKIINKFYNF